MRSLRRRLCLLGAVGLLAAATPARAQLATALATYDATDALGYTAPLRSALVAGLGNGLFTGGPFLDEDGFRARVAYRYVRVFNDDEDRTFIARGPLGTPRQNPPSIGSGVLINSEQAIEEEVPTLIGSGEAVLVENAVTSQTAAGVVFPGGFDLDAFSWTIPQLELGWRGYEIVLRYANLTTGTSELGRFGLFGLGGRADVTRFIDPRLPMQVAAHATYQNFDYADDLVSGSLWSTGVDFGRAFRWGHAYSGITFDRLEFSLDYTGPENEPTSATETTSRARLTVGGGLNLPYVQVGAEINYDSRYSVALGVSFGR